MFFSFSSGLSNAPWRCFRVLLFATILEPSVSPSTLKTLSFFNQEMLFSVISFIIISPSTLLECLVCLGFFFLIYWFLYFLAFLLLISTSLWFYFVCEPFLPYSSRTWIWFSAVTILFYSLPINFFNSATALCCFRKWMFSLIFLQSSSFFSTEVLVCLIISFYLSKSHLF